MLESDPEISTGSSVILPVYENRCELPKEVSRGEFFRSGSGNYDDVFSRLRDSVLVQPEPFTNDPFDARAPDRRPEPLLHNQAQAMVFETICNEIKTEMRGPRAFARLFYALEIRGAANPFVGPETMAVPP